MKAEQELKELRAWKESAMKQLCKSEALKGILPTMYLGWDVYEAAVDYISKLKTHAPTPAPPIKHMVERFLQWRLPDNFNPDGGISFKRMFNENTPYPMKHEPVGTEGQQGRKA